jgi:hypothetical protein
MATFQGWSVNLIDLGTTVVAPTTSASPGLSYVWNVDLYNTFLEELAGLLGEVIPYSNGGFGDVDVSCNILFTATPPDLVVRLVTTDTSIIAAKDPSALTRPSGGPSSGATYAVGSSVISEVFLDMVAGQPDKGELLARIAFHELMHNKLDAAPGSPLSDIHSQGGGGLAADAPLGATDHPTNTNCIILGRNLGRSVPQFSGTSIP